MNSKTVTPPPPMRPIYCENRKCTGSYPVGKARLTPGSEVSFSCKVCGHRTVKSA